MEMILGMITGVCYQGKTTWEQFAYEARDEVLTAWERVGITFHTITACIFHKDSNICHLTVDMVSQEYVPCDRHLLYVVRFADHLSLAKTKGFPILK